MKLFNTCSIVLLGAAAVHATDPGATAGATDYTPSTGTEASTPRANVGEGVGDSQLKNASTSKLMALAGPLLSCGKDMGQDWLMNLGIAKALGCMKGGVKKAGGTLRGVKKVAQYPKSAVCMAGLAAVPILIQRGHGAALVEKVRETISELSPQLLNLTNQLPSGDDAHVPKTSAVSGGAKNTTPKEPEVVQQVKGNSISRPEEEASQTADEERSEQEDGQQEANQQEASQEEASQEEDEGAPAPQKKSTASANAPASTNPKKSKGCFSCCAAA